MLPLTTADLLAHAIVGLVLENLDMERLVREVGQAVAQRILGNNESVDDVARELHEKLLLRNESTKKVVIESIYKESEEAKHNVQVFAQSASLAEARGHLRRVRLAFFLSPFSSPFFECLELTYGPVAVVVVNTGPRHEVHGQIPLRSHEPIPEHVLLPFIRQQILRVHLVRQTSHLPATVSPTQGRDRLRGLRRTEDGLCVRDRRRLDAILARGQ